uniref:Immunoglobulin domain-containing protein n=1 Tax=Scleropages formosus TaxID=113540 RepID=A0A8C9VVA5_SCLFO
MEMTHLRTLLLLTCGVSGIMGESVTFPVPVYNRGFLYYNDLGAVAGVWKGTGDTELKDKFRDRLQWDKQTGLFTITELKLQDEGQYKVDDSDGQKITTFQLTVYSRFSLFETTMRRRERDTVTLHTGVTDVQKDSQILWSFGSGIEDLIAQLINGATQTDINERFGDRLELDTQTGSLTIRNLNTSDSGVYLFHCVIVCVSGMLCAVGAQETTMRRRERDTVTLHTGVTDVQKDSQILWYSGSGIEDLIAQLINGATQTDINERFRDRLELDTQTGSLTIRNLNTSDSGVYPPLSCRSSSMNFTSLFSSNCSLSGSIFSQLPPSRAGVQTSDSNSTAGHRGPVLFLQATVFSGERQRCDPVLDQREGDAEPDQQSSSQHHPVSPSGHRGAGQ